MKTAVVTGGASGIGRAIAAALVERGTYVTIADINGDQAARVAAELSAAPREPGAADGPDGAGADRAGRAVGVTLDVTDAEAVAALLRSAHAEYGRLDLVFNNAGIAVGGFTDELTLDHWNRTIDVNLRGVVHGVHAAYPIMLEQGYGHIVNTASLAGLTPAPLMAPYTATKHAVVGLSMALRAEAASRGVKVSVVCPAFVDTPLLDNPNPGLPQTEVGKGAREAAIQVQRKLYTPEALARDVLRGIARNQAMIVAPASGRFAWRSARLFPSAAVRVAGAQVKRMRERARGR